jgi:hypothetical protein
MLFADGLRNDHRLEDRDGIVDHRRNVSRDCGVDCATFGDTRFFCKCVYSFITLLECHCEAIATNEGSNLSPPKKNESLRKLAGTGVLLLGEYCVAAERLTRKSGYLPNEMKSPQLECVRVLLIVIIALIAALLARIDLAPP